MTTARTVIAASLTLMLAACGGSNTASTEGPIASPTATLSPTPLANLTATPSPTATSTPPATPTSTPTSPPTPSPHPDAIAHFEVEDYDGYYDTTASNQGGDYRQDEVDIDAISGTNGYYVGWWASGEWLDFTNFNVIEAGNYQIRARVAAISSGRLARFELDGGNIRLGQMEIPNTGGWQSFDIVTVDTTLEIGNYTLRLFSLSDQWNIDWIEVIPGGAGMPVSTPVAQPPTEFTGELVWSDEFNSINSANWSFETGGSGWGNNELQYYTDGANASIEYDAQLDSNVLVIEARKEQLGLQCWNGPCEYTSTRMNTRFKHSFQYGRIEARIKLPRTQGIWPAFWMLGDNFNTEGWPEGGEIDIMEHVGTDNITSGALHGPGYSGDTPLHGSLQQNENLETQYHIFSIEWDTTGIRWFVNEVNFYSVTKADVEAYGTYVYDQPFWILLNIAVGGNWPGDPDTNFTTQRMYVDYVRVYQ